MLPEALKCHKQAYKIFAESLTVKLPTFLV